MTSSGPAMKTPRCERCSRRYRGTRDWNATLLSGVIVSVLCPTCQTTAENIEAVVHEATLDYDQNDDGRYVGRPRQ
jgi:hypothetical protein